MPFIQEQPPINIGADISVKSFEMIAEELNERGETYQPKGMKIEVKFTKDLLYLIYWRSLHENQYPNKKDNDCRLH